MKWVQLYSSLNIPWQHFSLVLEWKLNFSSTVATVVFQICWHIDYSTFTASSFRIWKSSTGILSPPLAFFVVMLSKAHLTSHSWMSGSRSVGVEYKSRKSRDTWDNRQSWPWSTKWSRAKANRVLPREHTGHGKHPLPTTQEKALHMEVTRCSILKSDWL